MTPWIANYSLKDVQRGLHFDPGPNSMLIQIVDPCMEFPVPSFTFKEVHKFEFLDLEEKDGLAHEFKISRMQAAALVSLLQQALDKEMNVIVHCVAGVCRSGAVAEVGTIMGFRDRGVYRSPNLMVKHYMLRYLGLTYDANEPFSVNGRHFYYDDNNNQVFYDEIEKGGDYGG